MRMPHSERQITPDDDSEFETLRLRCRRLRESDLDALHAVYSDPEVVRWVDDGQPISWEESRHWLAVTQANYAVRGYGMFAIVARASGLIIGFCGLVHPDGQVLPEAKYALAKRCWRRGLMSECLPALLDYGARVHGLPVIVATVFSDNLPSQRVALKSGMRLQHRARRPDGRGWHTFEWRATAGAPG